MLTNEAIVNSLSRLVPESVRNAGWMQPRYPLVGIELRDDAVIAVSMQRKGGKLQLAGHARRALHPGVLQSGLMKLAVSDPRELARAVQDALKLAGAESTHKLSVAIPDTVARVFLVDLQELPPSQLQAVEVIRLRLKKSVPFRLEDTRMSWQVLGRMEDGRLQVLVCLAPESALRPVETVFAAAGLRAGLVDIASFDLFNALRAAKQLVPQQRGDAAIINATPSYFSFMILRNERLVFYRSKNYHVQGGFQGEESLRVVGRELRTSLSYYNEHLLGEGISLTVLRVSGLDSAALAAVARQAGCGETVEATLGDMVPGFSAVDTELAPDLLPALGLVLRREV